MSGTSSVEMAHPSHQQVVVTDGFVVRRQLGILSFVRDLLLYTSVCPSMAHPNWHFINLLLPKLLPTIVTSTFSHSLYLTFYILPYKPLSSINYYECMYCPFLQKQGRGWLSLVVPGLGLLLGRFCAPHQPSGTFQNKLFVSIKIDPLHFRNHL